MHDMHLLPIYIQPNLQYILYGYIRYFCYTDGVHGTKPYMIKVPKSYTSSMSMYWRGSEKFTLSVTKIMIICYNNYKEAQLDGRSSSP